MSEGIKDNREMGRRSFLASAAAAGTGLAVARTALGQGPEPGTDDLNIAVIGVGAQGRVLTDSLVRIPGLRFKAICDIWSYSQRYGERYLKKYGHDVNVYEDYRELLEKETDLDAVVIATPDWMHAEHAIACMEAGLHVYCEKEMSNSLEKAKQMVLTSRKTDRLLQIGHQRRSNPRYIHAIETLVHKEHLLGRVTQAYGQWNRAKSDDLLWPKAYEMDAATLAKWGYNTMSEFRNWRWYRKYGGGPIVDLGSHQIDLFSWVFGVNPKSVMAGGGVDFYKNHEWYDNVMTIYEYENDQGVSRAFYQVLTTTSHGGFGERFMGVNGTIEISEVPNRGNAALKEAHVDGVEWDRQAKMGNLRKTVAPIQASATKNVIVDVRETPLLGKWPLPIELAKPAHQPHLENFFDAIRFGKPLNCPSEIGYETAVAVLKCNEAVKAGRTLKFNEEDFTV
jgi:predicted dehydrogenase